MAKALTLNALSKSLDLDALEGRKELTLREATCWIANVRLSLADWYIQIQRDASQLNREEELLYDDLTYRLKNALLILSDCLSGLSIHEYWSDASFLLVEDTHAHEAGYMLSLRRNEIYRLLGEENSGKTAIQFSEQRYSDSRELVETDLVFSTEDLIKYFVTSPKTKRELWIADSHLKEWWPISWVLQFLYADGDYDWLYANNLEAEYLGVPVFQIPEQGKIVGNVLRGTLVIESLLSSLSTGSVDVVGYNKRGGSREYIPADRWPYLKMSQSDDGQDVVLQDGKLFWEQVSVRQCDVNSLLESYLKKLEAKG